jgi:hypothetical protein
MAEDWKKANEKRIKDYESVQKAKKTVAEYDPKEPNKPQWKKDNEARIKAFEAKPKAKAKAAEYKMPKSTTPDMDTTQGITGSRNNFDTGEVKAVVKEETKAAPAPVEERSTEVEVEEKRDPKEESRFSSSNPLGMKKGGSVSSASRRADGCAIRGKTRA